MYMVMQVTWGTILYNLEDFKDFIINITILIANSFIYNTIFKVWVKTFSFST